MASILIGVTINQEYNNPDFGISLPDEVMEQIASKYKSALEKSGMDDDDFGPLFYEQLKKEDRELADKLENAVYDTLYEWMMYDSLSEAILAMRTTHIPDEYGGYSHVFTVGNEIEIDMADFPRI
jgi:hypothetical protein